MKKFLNCSLFILLAFSFVKAQEESKSADWKTVSPVGEEFSVRFPQESVNRSFTDQKGNLSSGFYSVLFDNTYFFVRSEEGKSKYISEPINDFIRSNNPNVGAKNISGLDAVEYKFADADGYYNRILEIRTKRRTYFFQTLSETEDNKDVEQFFDSITFSDKVAQGSPETSRRQITPPMADTIKVPIFNSNRNSFPGGSGIGIGRTVPNEDKQNLSLRILSKPRPEYTDSARFYMISGVVRLRITFLEDGQIGEIATIKKLPFGLTRNAVKAAQQIKFSPQTKDGKPITVTKIVEFNFMVY